MGIVKRQGIYSTAIAYIGIVIGFLNIAYLFPKYFEPEQFGLRAVLTETSMIMSQFSLLGFAGVTNKYFPYFRNEETRHNGFLFIILIVPLLGFTLFSTFFLIFSNEILELYHAKSPLVTQYYLLIIPLTFFIAYMSIIEVYSRSFLKIIFTNFVKEILLRVFLTILILLFAYHFLTIHNFWIFFVISYAVCLLFLLINISRAGHLSFRPDLKQLNRGLFTEMITFGLFVMFAGAANMVVVKIDTIMLSYMTDLRSTGVYALALYIATIIETPKRAINQITDPLLAGFWKDNKLEEIDDLYKKTALNQLIVGLLLFLLLWLNIDHIFEMIPKKEIYQEGKYVILFLGIAKVFDMATGVNGEIISYSKYYRFGLYAIFLLAGLTIFTNYMFIPGYGINGAAFASAISVFIYNMVKYVFLLIKFKLQPFTKQTGITCVLALLTYLLISALDVQTHFLVTIAINSTLVCVCFMVPIIMLNVSPDLTGLVMKRFKRV